MAVLNYPPRRNWCQRQAGVPSRSSERSEEQSPAFAWLRHGTPAFAWLRRGTPAFALLGHGRLAEREGFEPSIEA